MPSAMNASDTGQPGKRSPMNERLAKHVMLIEKKLKSMGVSSPAKPAANTDDLSSHLTLPVPVLRLNLHGRQLNGQKQPPPPIELPPLGPEEPKTVVERLEKQLQPVSADTYTPKAGTPSRGAGNTRAGASMQQANTNMAAQPLSPGAAPAQLPVAAAGGPQIDGKDHAPAGGGFRELHSSEQRINVAVAGVVLGSNPLRCSSPTKQEKLRAEAGSLTRLVPMTPQTLSEYQSRMVASGSMSVMDAGALAAATVAASLGSPPGGKRIPAAAIAAAVAASEAAIEAAAAAATDTAARHAAAISPGTRWGRLSNIVAAAADAESFHGGELSSRSATSAAAASEAEDAYGMYTIEEGPEGEAASSSGRPGTGQAHSEAADEAEAAAIAAAAVAELYGSSPDALASSRSHASVGSSSSKRGRPQLTVRTEASAVSLPSPKTQPMAIPSQPSQPSLASSPTGSPPKSPNARRFLPELPQAPRLQAFAKTQQKPTMATLTVAPAAAALLVAEGAEARAKQIAAVQGGAAKERSSNSSIL